MDYMQLIHVLVMAATFVVGGVFMAFSDFIMGGLRQVAPGSGAEGMQGINRRVYRSVFLFTFLGLGPVYAGLMLVTGFAAPKITLAGTVYLLGVILVTMVGNVPLNNRLDRLEGAEAARYWPQYDRRWRPLNHLRTVSCLIAGGALAAALI